MAISLKNFFPDSWKAEKIRVVAGCPVIFRFDILNSIFYMKRKIIV